jgi:hypothetical protein
MNGDVGISVEERRRSEATKTIETSEDLVEDDGKTSPRVGITRSFFDSGIGLAEEIWGFANDVDEGALEERISRW